MVCGSFFRYSEPQRYLFPDFGVGSGRQRNCKSECGALPVIGPLDRYDVPAILQAGMKTAYLNQRLLANNIANADTPNFRPTELKFQETLLAHLQGSGIVSLRKTHPRHMEFTSFRPQLISKSRIAKNDQNNVDLDEQLVKMAENASRFGMYTRLMSKRFSETVEMLRQLNR